MNVKVKICGIRSEEAAQVAVEAGADFIGLNFVPSSRRHIDKERAKRIINSVKGKIKVVGIFQNQEISRINDLIDELSLEYVQLHGNENRDYIKEIKNTIIIKAISLSAERDVNIIIKDMRSYRVDYFLLDRLEQGKGEMIDLEKARIIVSKFPTFIAGGLHPDNVNSLVNQIKPYGIDVAGGIEIDGKEDSEKIIKFISHAKGEII